MEKASCRCDLPQAQCDLVAELWLQLRTSLVLMCENRAPLPKIKTSGHALSSTPTAVCVHREPSPGTATAQPYASLLAASAPTSTAVLTQRKSVRAPHSALTQRACLCAHPDTAGSSRSAPAPAHSLLRLGFALMAPLRRCLSAVSL